MQISIRPLGLLLASSLLLAAPLACTGGARPSRILTGKLELTLAASSPSPTSQVVPAPNAVTPAAVGLTIRSTGWKLDQLLVGRCTGSCDEAEVDAWLAVRADALYGLGYGCPLGEACVDDPKAWGFEEADYGSCPTNVHSMLQPIATDPELGLVDNIGVSTDCNAPAPALVEGQTYYVTGLGTECFHGSYDDCDEVRGVRFFQSAQGEIVDLGGTTDDRRSVRFENAP